MDVESMLRQPCKKEPLDIPLKKAKYHDDSYLLEYQHQQQYQAMILAQYRTHPYGFRPWMMSQALSAASPATAKHLPHLPYAAAVSIPYLSQEPPILQNPERVVRLSECERFEQSYQPNVALVPRGPSKSAAATTITLINGKEHEKMDYERDRERSRERSRDETDTIDADIKIKKERPQTPSEESISPEPRSESPQMLAKPLPPISNPAPISPEGQSGSSNEITSSTSPVPASTTASHKPNEPTKTSPPPSSIDNHHIHHLMLRSHHPHSKSSLIGGGGGGGATMHHHNHNSLTNGIYHSSHHHNHHHNHSHHKTNGIAGNSEFELSTDTDDDSLTGEADSSNNIATLDIAIEALKDTRPQERDKVLGIIKTLLSDNIQVTARYTKLKQELRRKDDEIAELQRKSNNDSTNSSQCSSINANTTSTTSTTHNHNNHNHKNASESITIKASAEQSSLVIETAPAASTTSTTTSIPTKSTSSSPTPNKIDSPSATSEPIAAIKTPTANTTTIIEVGTVGGAIELTSSTLTKNDVDVVVAVTTAVTVPEPRKKCETEVIRVPLKKSARRSPAEDTLVIMQPHKLRDEARDKPREMGKLLRYFDRTTKSPSPNPMQQTNLVVAAATAATAKVNEAT